MSTKKCLSLQRVWEDLLFALFPDSQERVENAEDLVDEEAADYSDRRADLLDALREEKKSREKTTTYLRRALLEGQFKAYSLENGQKLPIDPSAWASAPLPTDAVMPAYDSDTDEFVDDQPVTGPVVIAEEFESWFVSAFKKPPGRPKNSSPYARDDKPLVDEIRKLIAGGMLQAEAARVVATRAKGSTEPGAREKRLLNRLKRGG